GRHTAGRGFTRGRPRPGNVRPGPGGAAGQRSGSAGGGGPGPGRRGGCGTQEGPGPGVRAASRSRRLISTTLGENGSMTLAAEKLVGWRTAGTVGRKVAGIGEQLSAVDRARLFEDFGELVPEAERLVEEFTGLSPSPARSRAWVMSRDEWLGANLRGFERILEPFARKVVASRSNGAMASIRRTVLGAQVGGLLGYLGHRVLGQYDMFLPPDDDGLIYFVGANVDGVERKFRFPAREFRLWISLHEVTHRLQFGEAPWLRGYLTGLMDSYLDSVEIDPGWLLERLRA